MRSGQLLLDAGLSLVFLDAMRQLDVRVGADLQLLVQRVQVGVGDRLRHQVEAGLRERQERQDVKGQRELVAPVAVREQSRAKGLHQQRGGQQQHHGLLTLLVDVGVLGGQE